NPCLFQMTNWSRLFLFCWALGIARSAPTSQFAQKNKNDSLNLTRTTRKSVQHLLEKYKLQMGNIHLEDHSYHLRDLPLLSTDFNNWFQMTDWTRLHGALGDIQTYWSMLGWKRKQLEQERDVQMDPSLLQSIRHVQHDLCDLMKKVNSEMRGIKSSWVKPAPCVELQNLGRSSRTLWESRVEGYIILRDLHLYLTKLARDFLLLASKSHS
ncbi:PREDICTED: uncharacterized protein LOC107101001, partial [Cyprinodon variegatus]|uniref:uncharacterized protein LOC107101001 n=1 Tax=Cyprinodon variegatus TaxID=28743 RepID=UPI00074268AB